MSLQNLNPMLFASLFLIVAPPAVAAPRSARSALNSANYLTEQKSVSGTRHLGRRSNNALNFISRGLCQTGRFRESDARWW